MGPRERRRLRAQLFESLGLSVAILFLEIVFKISTTRRPSSLILLPAALLAEHRSRLLSSLLPLSQSRGQLRHKGGHPPRFWRALSVWSTSSSSSSRSSMTSRPSSAEPGVWPGSSAETWLAWSSTRQACSTCSSTSHLPSSTPSWSSEGGTARVAPRHAMRAPRGHRRSRHLPSRHARHRDLGTLRARLLDALQLPNLRHELWPGHGHAQGHPERDGPWWVELGNRGREDGRLLRQRG